MAKYTLPTATENILGGIKLSDDFATDDSRLYSPAWQDLQNSYNLAKIICS